MALAGPWAIVMHIALTRVRGWSQSILLEHHPGFAVGFCLLAFILIGGISLALFKGQPKRWPWGKVLSIIGMSVVSAVLLTASVALESATQPVNTDLAAVSPVSFEVAFLSFFVVLMKAIIVGDSLLSQEEGSPLSWWKRAKLGFRAGRREVQ
jgi:hypothetical protein